MLIHIRPKLCRQHMNVTEISNTALHKPTKSAIDVPKMVLSYKKEEI